MFKLLGFTDEKAQEQFHFLMNAFKYGAPPHGGLALWSDRWVFVCRSRFDQRLAIPENNWTRC